MKFYSLLPIFLLLTCCQLLTPVKDAAVFHLLDSRVSERALTASSPAMAIKRPSLPGYLDRQQLVTRANGQLMIHSLHLWAEPLDVGISRVTASNLSRLTSSTGIQPVENFNSLDYTTLLELRITRFEPDVSNQMILEGVWKRQPIKGGNARGHFFRITAVISPATSPMIAHVDAMNECLEHLARQIIHR